MPAPVLDVKTRDALVIDFSGIASKERPAWPSIVVILATLCSGVLMFGSVEPFAYSILGFGILAALAVVTLETWRRNEREIHLSPLLLPMGAFALVVLTQLTAGMTAYAYVSQVEAIKFASYAVLVCAVTQSVRSDHELRGFAFALTAFGFVFACFAILQQLSGTTKIYGFHAVPHAQNMYGSYANRDHYSGLMELLVPLPLTFAFAHSLPRSWRTLAAVCSIVMAASVVLSTSRGGLVAVVSEFIFLSFFLWSSGRGKRYFALLSGFFIGTCLLLYWLDANPAILRWKQLSIGEEMASGRLAIVRDALHMWRMRPLLGFGVGTFTNVYPQFRSFYTDVIVNEVHNDYVQVLVETGIAGALAMMWFIVTLYRRGMMSRRSTRNDLRDLIRLGALTGCTGLLVHSFFDFNLHIPANAAMFFALAAIICLPARSSTQAAQR